MEEDEDEGNERSARQEGKTPVATSGEQEKLLFGEDYLKWILQDKACPRNITVAEKKIVCPYGKLKKTLVLQGSN